MTPKREIDLTATEQALAMGREELFAKIDKEMRKLRESLLTKLANAEDAASLKIVHFEAESPTLIANAQVDLRKLWTRSTPFSEKQRIVDAWLAPATKRAGRAGIHAWLGRGLLEFDYQSFPGQFVQAILENWWRFQVCGNPDCKEPYFLTRRSTQRYCERGECTRYAQRKHALNYWRSKGKANRQSKEKKHVGREKA